jgi:hypothetical protein
MTDVILAETVVRAGLVLAWIFGPYLLIQGIWMFAHRKNLMKICKSLRETPAAVYLSGWLSLLIGLTVVNLYNVWETNFGVFLTILGWAYVLRGLVVLFMPRVFLKVEAHEKTVMPTMAVVRVVWGLLIVWFGYMQMQVMNNMM